jgi:hypothetical protein
MNFWRFDIQSKTAVDDSISSRSLVLPTQRHPAGKNDPASMVDKKIKVGDGLLLAQLQGAEGVVHAIGVVRELQNNNHGIVVDWVCISHKLQPNPQGGLAQWQKEICFKFADAPAKRYNLGGLFQKHFKIDP